MTTASAKPVTTARPQSSGAADPAAPGGGVAPRAGDHRASLGSSCCGDFARRLRGRAKEEFKALLLLSINCVVAGLGTTG
jgi:hypothetical protein